MAGAGTRAAALAEAKRISRRVTVLVRCGHGRNAEAELTAYVFKHGITPAEHALKLRTEQVLFDSPKWSPQP